MEWAARLIQAGNYTNPDLIAAIQQWFLTMDTSLLRTEYGYLDVTDLTGGTNAQRLDQSKFNAVKPLNTDAAFRQIFTGNPTMGLDGIKFNGTNQFSDTKCNPSLCTLISLNEATYMKSVKHYANFGIDGCWDGVSVAMFNAPYYSAGYSITAINAGSNTNGIGSDDCISTAYRLASNLQVTRINGVNYNEGRASVAMPNCEILRGATLNSSTSSAQYFSNAKNAGECVGAYKNLAEISNMEIAFNNFNAAVESIFSLSPFSRRNF